MYKRRPVYLIVTIVGNKNATLASLVKMSTLRWLQLLSWIKIVSIAYGLKIGHRFHFERHKFTPATLIVPNVSTGNGMV